MSKLDHWIAVKTGVREEPLQREQVEQWQLEEMNRLLHWCREHSRYYKNYPESISSLEELQTLPLLCAEDIVERGNEMVCVSQSDVNRVVTMQTSGTSGQSKRLYFTKDDQQLTVDFFACGLSELNHPGDVAMVLMPGNRPGGMSALIQEALRTLDVTPVGCDPHRPYWEIAQELVNNRVTTMVGAPAQLLSLGRFMKHYGIQHEVHSVLVSSDYLSETVRKGVEETLHCDLFDHYGITEGGLGFSIECEKHEGLHVRENDVLVEIIDPKTGKRVPDGQWGELVFTTLTRRAMPLIRYRTGDKTMFYRERCACGSVVTRMHKVEGRYRQLEERYCMSVLDEYIFRIPELIDYQVSFDPKQKELHFTMLLCKQTEDLSLSVRNLLKEILVEGDSVTIEPTYLSGIPDRTAKGYYQGKRTVIQGV